MGTSHFLTAKSGCIAERKFLEKFMMKFTFILLLTIFSMHNVHSTQMSLEEINDTELVKLINQETYVVVLFSNENGKSNDMEIELAGIREDLVETLNDIWVVKAVDSKLKDNFNPGAKEPQVVFFRRSIPVLYEGPANEDEILETLMAYRDPCVKDLTDTSFEHLTQAATGATTGDWLVLFFKDECEECHLIRAKLETIGCKNRGRINVARVNKGTTGAVTGRRFEVGAEAVPALIFFRLGGMYRYTLEKYDVESLDSFVNGWYKNLSKEKIPLPKTPFDDVVQMCVDYLREYPLLCGLMIGLPIILFIAFIYLTASSPEKPKSKKTKKKKSEKDQ